MNLKKELDRIIDEELVYPVFQPIVNLSNGEIVGYEALSRLKKTDVIKDPETLFKLAGLYSKLWDVEQLCRKKILKQVSTNEELLDNKRVFININPLVMTDRSFKQGFTRKYIEKHNINAGQVVMEITEHSAVTDMNEFRGVIEHYKEQGYAIAVDDAGSCYSGLNMICDIKPHYLKLDIEMIREICTDAVKSAMVKSFVEFATITGIRLIAEGIETEEQLKMLMELGVQYGQGFFLRRPDKEILPVLDKALDIIEKHNYRRVCEHNSYMGDYSVAMVRLGKQKSLLAYERKYGEEKCKNLMEQLNMCIEGYLAGDEIFKWIEAETGLLVLKKVRCEEICEQIKNNYAKYLSKLYDKEDMDNGYIVSENRSGEKKKYPIVEVRYEIVV